MLLGRSVVGTFARISVRSQHGILNTGQRSAASSDSSCTIVPLVDRAFVRVQGADSASFLQGLMTNDMRHFEHCGAMYAMFLKANGRVFCDALIYRRPKGKEWAEDDYLLECDSSVAPRLEKHLKLYRLKKKVQVSSEDTFQMWVAFRNGTVEEDGIASGEMIHVPNSLEATDRLHLLKDPRLTRLGYRVLSSCNEQAETTKHLQKVFPGANAIAPSDSACQITYASFRYSLGVGEGAENLPDGKCFPLECNCDYLHGVSFHKGCYIGQELTARTYHTGVVRKRLMPLEFDEPLVLRNVPREALRDAEIKNQDGAVVGKLRGLAGNFGLGLLRIEKVLSGGPLAVHIAGVTDPKLCRTRKPFWWPKETNTHH